MIAATGEERVHRGFIFHGPLGDRPLPEEIAVVEGNGKRQGEHHEES